MQLPLLVICYLFMLTAAPIRSEVIMLTNEKQVVCVLTNESVDPSSPSSGFNKAHINLAGYDNWMLTDSSNFPYFPITDERWEHFKIVERTGVMLLKPICFSTCNFDSSDFKYKVIPKSWDYSPKIIDLECKNEKFVSNGSCQWFNYTVVPNGTYLEVFGTNCPNSFYIGFMPKSLSKEGEKRLLKLHEYTFWYSNTTSGPVGTPLKLPSYTERIYLFVSMDNNCFLQITINGFITKTINATNLQVGIKKWEKIKIQIDSADSVNLNLFRGRYDNEKTGYWAIDNIKFYRRKIETYNKTLLAGSADVVCSTLDGNASTFCMTPGYLGQKCDIKCAEILGSSYSFCQGYNICLSYKNCRCAWGYQGKYCDQDCSEGYWGLNCATKCSCAKCDKYTGECIKSETNFTHLTTPVLATTPKQNQSICADKEMSKEKFCHSKYKKCFQDFCTSLNTTFTHLKSKTEEIKTCGNYNQSNEKFSVNCNLKIVDEELPQKIILSDNKIKMILNSCIDFKGPLSYSYVYRCIVYPENKEIVRYGCIHFDFYINPITLDFENLTPLRKCEIVLTATRYSEQFSPKNYSDLTLENVLLIQDLTVYNKNEETLWIRWKISHLLPKYAFVTYKFNFENTFRRWDPCKLWKDYICANLTNLKSHTQYNLTLQAKIDSLGLFGNPASINTVTNQSAPDPPQTLFVKSSMPQKIVLAWTNPFLFNGPLKYFDVLVTNEGTTILEKRRIVDAILEEYSEIVELEYTKKYLVKIVAVNKNKSNPAILEVTVLPPILKFSPNPFVESCSKNCSLLVPDSNLSFEFLMRRTESDTNQPKLITTQKRISHNHFEIFNEFNKSISVNDPSYNIYFVVYESKTMPQLFPIPFLESTEKSSVGVYVFILLGLTSVTTLLLVLAYYIYMFKKHSRNVNIEENVEMPLLPKKDTVINVEDLEIYSENISVLKTQFKSYSIQAPNGECTIGLEARNINKNRDRQFIPYDHNRVILKELQGVGSGDYINASYIDGYDRPRAFIACQGPKLHTVKDFWRMIWQEQVETIVMASNLIENQKRMCAEYWPPNINAIFECGEMIIKLCTESLHEYYSCRTFEVNYDYCTRKILHVHLKWDSENVDFFPNNVVPVMKLIRQIYEKSLQPIVVHSGYGIDRTGTLILCDLALQMAKLENKIDFYALVQKIRKQRPKMISKEEQYILAHFIVRECLMEENSPFVTTDENISDETFNDMLDYLNVLSRHDELISSLNNIKDVKSHRLQSVEASRYGNKRKYLVVQEPNEKHITEFWKMVGEESINCIVFLRKKFPTWIWKNRTDTEVVKVEHVKTLDESYCIMTEFSLLIYEKSTKKISFY